MVLFEIIIESKGECRISMMDRPSLTKRIMSMRRYDGFFRLKIRVCVCKGVRFVLNSEVTQQRVLLPPPCIVDGISTGNQRAITGGLQRVWCSEQTVKE